MNKHEISLCKEKFNSICSDEKYAEEAAVCMMQLSGYVTAEKARVNELKEKSLFKKFINFFTGDDVKLRNAILSDNEGFQNTVIQLFSIAWKLINENAKRNVELNEKIYLFKKETREEFLKLKKIILFNVEATENLAVQKWAENINNSKFTDGNNRYEGQLFKDVKPDILKLICVVNAFYRKTQGKFNIELFSSLENALCKVFREGVLDTPIYTQYQYRNRNIVKKCFEKLIEGINVDLNLIKQKQILLDVPNFAILCNYYSSDKAMGNESETVKAEFLTIDFLLGLQLIDVEYKADEKYEEALEHLQNDEIEESILLFQRLSKNKKFADRANAFLAIIIHELFVIKSQKNCLEPELNCDSVDVQIKKLLAKGQNYDRGNNYCRALNDIWYEENCESWVKDDSQLESEELDVLDCYIHGLYHKNKKQKLNEKKTKKRKKENELFIKWSLKIQKEFPLANCLDLMNWSDEEYDLNLLADLKYGHLPNYSSVDLAEMLLFIN